MSVIHEKPHAGFVLDIKSNWLPLSWLLFLSFYLVIEASVFRVGLYHKLVYAFLLIFTFCLSLCNYKEAFNNLEYKKLAFGIFALLLLYFIPVFTQDVIYPAYVLGDAASLFFVLFLLLFLMTLRIDDDSLIWLVFFFIFAGYLGSMLATVFTDHAHRFKSPPTWLWGCITAFILFNHDRKLLKFLGGCIFILLIGLAIGSAERTSQALALLCCTVFFYSLLLRLNHNPLRAFLILCLIFIIIALALSQLDLHQYHFSFDRWRLLIRHSFQHDYTLTLRYLEVKDVLFHWQQDLNPVTFLLGHGHGATYLPRLSSIPANTTDEGLVHNIHFTPALVLFRYGVVGVISWIVASTYILFQFFRIFILEKPSEYNLPGYVSIFTLTLYFLDSLFRNVLVEPMCSLCLALLLCKLCRISEKNGRLKV